MKKIGLILGAASFICLYLFASTSFACGGCNRHGGSYAQSNLTDEQGQQLDAINDKYAKQLETIQDSLNEKSREYKEVRANDNTTVGTLNKLEAEMADLEKQYGKVLDQANSEADEILPDGYGPQFACGYGGCNHQHHRWDASKGRHMGSGPRHGMGGRHMGPGPRYGMPGESMAPCWSW